jgi:DNA-binding IclR family transcriptional regulator
LAILGALPDGVRQGLATQLAEDVWLEGKLPKADFLDSVERTHKNGYSFIRNRVTLGTSAVGVALRDGLGNPVAAISVAAVDARMTEPRVATVEKVLRREAVQLDKALREGRAFSER